MQRAEMIAGSPCEGLFVRHFLLAEKADWNDQLEHPWSITGLVTRLGFPQDETLIVVHEWYAYCQAFGTDATYALDIRLRQIMFDEDGHQLEEPHLIQEFGPFVVEIMSEDFVHEFAMSLPNIRFEQTGYYDFELWYHNGGDEALATERVWVKPS